MIDIMLLIMFAASGSSSRSPPSLSRRSITPGSDPEIVSRGINIFRRQCATRLGDGFVENWAGSFISRCQAKLLSLSRWIERIRDICTDVKPAHLAPANFLKQLDAYQKLISSHDDVKADVETNHIKRMFTRVNEKIHATRS